jgi:hypothetical protein
MPKASISCFVTLTQRGIDCNLDSHRELGFVFIIADYGLIISHHLLLLRLQIASVELHPLQLLIAAETDQAPPIASLL